METAVSYLLVLQKYINLSQKYPLCLGNTSKDFTIDNSKTKTGLKESVKCFPVDYRSLNTNTILDIYKHLMKELFFKYFMELM